MRMQVKPSTWSFVLESVCCANFKDGAYSDQHEASITTNGHVVYYYGRQISYCPFCGTPITIFRK